MDISTFVRSKNFRNILLGVAGLAIILVVFGLGVFVGFRQAGFTYNWEASYHRNFGGPGPGMMHPPFGSPGEVMNANGTAGSVLQINGSTIVMKSNNNTEKMVVVGNNTVIRSGRQDVQLNDVKNGDTIVVIGQPDNSGQIQAEFIRVFNNQQ